MSMLVNMKTGTQTGQIITQGCEVGRMSFRRLGEMLRASGEIKPNEVLSALSINHDGITYYTEQKEQANEQGT